jgi:hypothetical protein
MVKCQYVLLSVFFDESDISGSPALLILQAASERRSKRHYVYCSEQLPASSRTLSASKREWIVALVSEIAAGVPHTRRTGDALMEFAEGLSVGPLRTTHCGQLEGVDHCAAITHLMQGGFLSSKDGGRNESWLLLDLDMVSSFSRIPPLPTTVIY